MVWAITSCFSREIAIYPERDLCIPLRKLFTAQELSLTKLSQSVNCLVGILQVARFILYHCIQSDFPEVLAFSHLWRMLHLTKDF